MKSERPILFSAPMVRALLAGQKTQTRRVIRKQPAGEWAAPGKMACPYGQPGDHLWVRETFCAFDESTPENTGEVFYRADDELNPLNLKWTPSIYMPRWASRITLEVVNVQVERLQEITDEGARAEGMESARWTNGNGTFTLINTPRATFAGLWNEINSTRAPWESNPWVWVVEFKRWRS